MIQSDHIKLRYVQRVVGIEEEQEAIRYINHNKEKVFYELSLMYQKSELLLESFRPEGSNNLYDYYMYNNTFLIVTSAGKDVGITLYKINVDPDKVRNQQIVMEYISKTKQNTRQIKVLNNQKEKHDIETRKIEYQIQQFKKYLEQLEGEFNMSVEIGKEYVSKIKALRHDNRDMADTIMYGFKEFDKM